jgi:beta-lactam-binding protein with PASTA domain
MQQDIKNIREQLMRMPILYHLIAAIFILCILLFLVLKGLNIYTRHNQAVVIPDVKGMLISEAALFFDNNGLRYSIVDSIFSKEVAPGAIVDVYPSIGSKVKEGRIISVTLNAMEVEKSDIPDVSDLSYRQAHASLQARGFTSIEIKYIHGTYRDLAVDVELKNGRKLRPGESIPLSSALVLNVSDGGETPDSDSVPSGEPMENVSPIEE